MARMIQGVLPDSKEYDLKDGDSIEYELNTGCIRFLAHGGGGMLFFQPGSDNKHLIGSLSKDQFEKIADLIADLHGGLALWRNTTGTNADDCWILEFRFSKN